MLEGRVKDLAAQKRGSSKADLDARRTLLQKALGLYPLPPRPDLKARVTGTIPRDGYRIEKLRYESRPGLLVTAHLYLPEASNTQYPTPQYSGPRPLIVSAHDTQKGKKAAPFVQARGIAFALRGFATLVVDAPGSFGDDLSLDERGTIGAPGDPALAAGTPWIGEYAWDLIRGVDACLGRPDIDPVNIGITGDGDGGIAALMAFALEPRFLCAALVCTAPSMEQKSLESIAQLGLPGIALAGDFSDILALRAPAPVMLIGAKEDDRFHIDDLAKTAEKLARVNRNSRFEPFEGGHDYNRRMREATAAFFAENILQEPRRVYLPELRPLTDGLLNPYPSGTAPADAPELLVTELAERGTLTFSDLLRDALTTSTPAPFRAEDRFVPWLRYAPHPGMSSASVLGLHDSGVAAPKIAPSIELPADAVDFRLAWMAGLGVCEIFAQVLHLTLPGRPETWEREAIAGDGLSAMIASVKTLVKSASGDAAPTRVVGEGPVSSLTAMFLKLCRPNIEIETSHTWSGWTNLLETPGAELIQPLARYLEWPF